MSFLGNAFWIGAFAAAAIGQIGPNPIGNPRPLQTALKRSDAQVIWSNEAGRLETGDVRVVFTALAIKDGSRAGHEIRGVRVAASSHDWNGTIYIEEPEFQLLKPKVELWVQGAERFNHTDFNGISSTACPEDEHLHLPIAFAYIYHLGSAPELMVAVAGFPDLLFSSQTPSDVAAILARATAELNSRKP